MTPKEFLKSKFEADANSKIELTAFELAELLQEYANLQKPEWIPIIDGDLSELPNGGIWITAKDIYGKLFVSQVGGYWVKTISEIPILAWMPYTEPTPYQPQPKISKVHGSYGYKVYDDTDTLGRNFSDADPGL